ncbi:MAG TPA: PQQ-binding-like beta-propeller repeat protein [Thermoanaerobaculia bacterium]|nr:PQQ-binding-like beta-propeller repeat protein [Thermoanaerobaculia bacterium]
MVRAQIALLVLLFAAMGVAAQTDPVAGNWKGVIEGPGGDHAAIAFAFTADAGGALTALLYQPVLNVYGAPVTLQRDGATYTIPELGAELTLANGELSGTVTRLKFPMRLQRTEELPQEVPVPANLPKGPAPRWQTKLGGMVYAAVAVRDGIAYVGTTGGVFNAVHMKDGTFAWTFSAGRPIYGEALVTSDAVYFVCDNGFLFKLERSSGKELWRYDLGDALVPRILQHPAVFDWDYLAPKPVLADGVLYAGSGDGSLHAVDAATAKRIWRFETKGKVRADALVDGPRVYIGSLDNGVYAIDRKSGAQLWRQETRAPVTSSPALIDGKVISGNRGPGLVALDPANGEILWRALYWGSWVESSAVAYGDRFYIGSSDLRRVSCYDPKDGRLVWRTDVYGWSWGRPAVTEKLVYAGVAGGSPYVIRHVASLTALDRTTGAIVWRWVPPENNALQYGFPAGPVVADGKTLVIAALDGTLYAFPLT